MEFDENYICQALVHNGYDLASAQVRAPQILQFISIAGLERRLVAYPSLADTRQLEFLTGDESCSVDRADVVTFEIVHPPKTEWIGGTWMESAPLTYLARVCDIGQRMLGADWSQRFKDRLLNRGELLNVLNEIWWLGCWTDLRNLKMGPKAKLGGDNDWGFGLGEALGVNLQVKRRRNDLLRKNFPGRPPYGLFDKVADRFSSSEKNELNVGAITIYSGITPAVLRVVDDYFKSAESSNVDAVILWSPGVPEGCPPFFIRARKHAELLKSFFRLDPVDFRYDTINSRPLSIREAIDAPMPPIE